MSVGISLIKYGFKYEQPRINLFYLKIRDKFGLGRSEKNEVEGYTGTGSQRADQIKMGSLRKGFYDI